MVSLRFAKPKRASVKPAAILDFGNGGAGASALLKDGKYSNVIPGSVKLGVAQAGESVLKSANIRGKINKFKDNFKVDGGKLVFTGTKNPTLDPSNTEHKNEFQGYIGFSYMTLDGETHYDYYKVNIKLNKDAKLGN